MVCVGSEWQAVTKLHEVVRRVPRVADPYHTLGLIYEETGDQLKALEFYLIAVRQPSHAPLALRG